MLASCYGRWSWLMILLVFGSRFCDQDSSASCWWGNESDGVSLDVGVSWKGKVNDGVFHDVSSMGRGSGAWVLSVFLWFWLREARIQVVCF